MKSLHSAACMHHYLSGLIHFLPEPVFSPVPGLSFHFQTLTVSAEPAVSFSLLISQFPCLFYPYLQYTFPLIFRECQALSAAVLSYLYPHLSQGHQKIFSDSRFCPVRPGTVLLVWTLTFRCLDIRPVIQVFYQKILLYAPVPPLPTPAQTAAFSHNRLYTDHNFR